MHTDPKIQKCIEACTACALTCEKTILHCTSLGGKHAEPKHLMLLRDCAEICKVSADFMERGSTHMKCLCDECAEICEECAESCEKVDPTDTQMQECAKECRESAQLCRAM